MKYVCNHGDTGTRRCARGRSLAWTMSRDKKKTRKRMLSTWWITRQPPRARLSVSVPPWFLLLCLAGWCAGAKPPAPEKVPALHVTPMAVAPGVAGELRFTGEGLGKPVALWTSFAAETSAVAGEGGVRFRVKAADSTQVGIGAVRVMTSSGVANVQLFMIDDLPTLPREPGRHAASEARVLPEAVAVEGAGEALASDFYAIEGKKGRSVSIEVVAQRLGSRMDPVVRLLGPDGREVAYCDDFPGVGSDCRLRYAFEADGRYVLELRDVNYEGGDNYFYRLRVGDFPLATCAFPAAGKRGATTAIRFDGVGAERLEATNVEISDGARRVPVGVRYPAGMGSGFVSLLAADAPDFVTSSANHSPSNAATISVPATVSGRFLTAGHRDYYAFEAKRGRRISVRGQTRSIGSASDLGLAITDASGRKLTEYVYPPTADAKKAAAAATSEPPPVDEGASEVEIPTDGTYRIAVWDLARGAGPGMVYRLVVEPGGPDFSLSTEGDKTTVAPGGSTRVKVACARKGFEGEISLSLGNARGLTGTGKIGAGKTEGEIEIMAPQDLAKGLFGDVTVVGTATVGGSQRTHVASTAAVVQKVYPRVRFVTPDLDGLVAVGVK